MTDDERKLLIYTATYLAESLRESATSRGTTNNLAEEMYKLIDKTQDDQEKAAPSSESQEKRQIRALQLSFQILLKNVALSGGQRMANIAKREAIAAAKALDTGDLWLPAQVELLYAEVKSDRMDGT